MFYGIIFSSLRVVIYLSFSLVVISLQYYLHFFLRKTLSDLLSTRIRGREIPHTCISPFYLTDWAGL